MRTSYASSKCKVFDHTGTRQILLTFGRSEDWSASLRQHEREVYPAQDGTPESPSIETAVKGDPVKGTSLPHPPSTSKDPPQNAEPPMEG